MSYLSQVDSDDYDVYSTAQSQRLTLNPVRLEWDRWLVMMESVGGVRGKAVAALSRMLSPRLGMTSIEDGMRVTEHAIDLLRDDSDDVCAAVAALLADDWKEGPGRLLSCARAIAAGHRD